MLLFPRKDSRDLLFSVVIPTHARPQLLVRCLEALAQQQLPHDVFEVVVVDDGNLLPEGFENSFPPKLDLKIVRQQRSGAAVARNRGALHASGRYLAFVDDDCEPDPNWLSALERSLRAHPEALIGGCVVNALPGNRYSATSQLLVDFFYTFHIDRGVPQFFCSDNLALPREAFQKLGGFDESFSLLAAEDRDFCARWTHAGGSRIYAQEAVVYHAHALTLAKFCRQHFRYGRGAFYLRRRSESEGRGKLRLEPFRFYFHLLKYPFQAAKGEITDRLEISLLFALSQLVIAGGFFAQALLSRGKRERKPAVGIED